MNINRKISGLMDQDDHRAFVIFVIISFFASLIEVAGIGSIMPFIGVLMRPDIIHHNKILWALYNMLHFTSDQQFIVFIGTVSLTILIFGGVINIFALHYQLRVTFRIGHKLALRLLKAYLSQPYNFFLSTNSNTIKTVILSDVDRMVAAVLVPCGVIISKAMVIVILIAMLLLVSPVGTFLLMITTGGVYAGLLFYFRKRVHIRGQNSVEQNKIRFKTANEAFSSIRDIKLHDNAGFFIEKFREASDQFNRAQAYSIYHGQLPKFIIEMIGFVALISLILYMIVASSKTANEIVPMIALFAASGYKVLPAAQNLYASFSNIRFYTASIDMILAGLALPKEHTSVSEADASLDFQREITMHDVCFSYAGRTEPVLQSINCTILKNSLVGIVGATGAGKSTLIDILIGLIPAKSGQFAVDGVAITAGNTNLWQRQIGYVPQKVYLLDDSIESNIAFGQTISDPVVIQNAAAMAQISGFIATLPAGYKTSVGEQGDHLSGGQRQRIGIARALYRDPAILVLDEPTSALDAETARQLGSTLKSLSQYKTIILITHATEILEHCDQVMSLEHGKLKARQKAA